MIAWPWRLPDLQPVHLHHYLTVSALLFSIGLAGILTRRGLRAVLLAAQLTFGAAILSFAAFSAYLKDLPGQAAALFILMIAAMQIASGLVLTIFIRRGNSSTILRDPTKEP